jgi:hypothetical protein
LKASGKMPDVGARTFLRLQELIGRDLSTWLR